MGCRLSKSISQNDLQDLCKEKHLSIRGNNKKTNCNGNTICCSDTTPINKNMKEEEEENILYVTDENVDVKNNNNSNNDGLLSINNPGLNGKQLSIIESSSQVEFFKMLDEKIAQGAKNLSPELEDDD
ncbi:Protein of unknown function DUF4612 family-containing protein [Strongyloides ratti]|uniref:Uncharacterized protein n=1 Tax=Strongyloides ratti TaxID=34506 RepID=A0A090L7Q9_STRRB|nr:Protein of unknown function DUF4612 family-containing protein [Strongyloides ratti]CEF63559.1 Protein of unknown function DUF4612 family-containing protein [Strongyloides ratti]